MVGVGASKEIAMGAVGNPPRRKLAGREEDIQFERLSMQALLERIRQVIISIQCYSNVPKFCCLTFTLMQNYIL